MALAEQLDALIVDAVTTWTQTARHRWPPLLVIVLVSLLMVACSTSSFTPGTADAPRTIRISATDALEFSPSQITIAAGETVRFLVTNEGVLTHEFAIGSGQQLEDHAMVMSHRGMSANTGEAVWLPPGQTVELIHRFGSATDVRFACMVFDHYPRGMHGEFTVIPSGS